MAWQRARASCAATSATRSAGGSSGLLDEAADLVVTNPPFFDAREVRVSPEARRAAARMSSIAARPPTKAGAAIWKTGLPASLRLLRGGGRFIMIHRPDALAQILGRFRAPARRDRDRAHPPPRGRAGARILVSDLKDHKEPLRYARPSSFMSPGRVYAVHRGASSGRGAHRLA